jgi:hypothetical protein
MERGQGKGNAGGQTNKRNVRRRQATGRTGMLKRDVHTVVIYLRSCPAGLSRNFQEVKVLTKSLTTLSQYRVIQV